MLCMYCTLGVNHNIPVLRDIITQPLFVSGDITTNFIAEVYPDGFKGQQEHPLLCLWHCVMLCLFATNHLL